MSSQLVLDGDEFVRSEFELGDDGGDAVADLVGELLVGLEVKNFMSDTSDQFSYDRCIHQVRSQ